MNIGKALITLLVAGMLTFAYAGVGKVIFIKGNVDLIRNGQVMPAKAGMMIEEKDAFKTGPQAKARLHFNDDTFVTLGKQTEFKTEVYLFDETQNKAQSGFSVGKGIFKVATGRIGKIAPDNFKLKTRTATMGIRGTVFGGIVTEEKEQLLCLKGAISVKSEGVERIVEAGNMTLVKSNQPPRKPRPIPARTKLLFNAETTTVSFGECKMK